MPYELNHYSPVFANKRGASVSSGRYISYNRDEHSRTVKVKEPGRKQWGRTRKLYSKSVELSLNSELDSPVSTLYERMLEGRPPEGQDRVKWAQFLLAQFVRTPGFMRYERAAEQNKAVAHTWLLEGFNNCDLSQVEKCLTEDYINHSTTEVRGYEGGRQVLTQAQAWAPDGKIVIHSTVAEGDTVMVLFTFEGTHAGSIGGMAPTGKRFSLWRMSLTFGMVKSVKRGSYEIGWRSKSS